MMIRTFTMELHVPEDFACVDFTFGIHCVCHHKAVICHQQALKEVNNNNNNNNMWIMNTNTQYFNNMFIFDITAGFK